MMVPCWFSPHVLQVFKVFLWHLLQLLPSGELTRSYGKIHHFISGKIHYLYGHFPLLFVSSPEGNHYER